MYPDLHLEAWFPLCDSGRHFFQFSRWNLSVCWEGHDCLYERHPYANTKRVAYKLTMILSSVHQILQQKLGLEVGKKIRTMTYIMCIYLQKKQQIHFLKSRLLYVLSHGGHVCIAAGQSYCLLQKESHSFVGLNPVRPDLNLFTVSHLLLQYSR